MRILSVSDVVISNLYDNFEVGRFPKIDLILSCGDLPPEYLSNLCTSFNAPLYYVRGNHDIRYDLNLPGGCINLNAKIIQLQGIKMLGLEGSRWYNGGPVAFDPKFGGKKESTLSLPMRRHVISMMQKTYVTGGLKVSGGSLTTTSRTISSMATFMQRSMIPPNV